MRVPTPARPAAAPAPSGSAHRLRWPAVAVLAAAGFGLLGAACAKKDDQKVAAGGTEIKVALTDAGCEPTPATARAGAVVFAITNADSAKVTEVELKTQDLKHILGEKESLTPGLKGTFTLNLAKGTYKVVCPGAKQDTWDFVVTAGTTVADWRTNPQLVQAVKGYSAYVDQQAALLSTRTAAFVAAVKRGDVEQAKRAYAATRVPYERI